MITIAVIVSTVLRLGWAVAPHVLWWVALALLVALVIEERDPRNRW